MIKCQLIKLNFNKTAVKLPQPELSLAQTSACCVCIGHCSLIVKDQPSLSQHKARLAHTVCHGTHHPPTTKLVTYFLATLGN